MIGKTLGKRYELIEKVGIGGMAIVYKAKCHLLNRFVAVKVLRDEYIADKEFLEKFRFEAQSAASLSHQNIVNIYDVGMEETIPYIVMEYIDGVNLKEYIDAYDGFLKNEEIVDYAKQIASALEHAHSNNIIHRDIKPHNILVTSDGVLKVADFGIASAVSEATTNYTSEAIGSVRYTSPEQARGRNVDERTDIYSLGILMYEMATRSVPFEGETPVEIALKHMKDDIVVPTTINRCFNKGLESIVLRSLLKDISQRYQSAKEMIDDLNKIIQNPNENVSFYAFDSDSQTQILPNLDEYNVENDKRENRTMTNTNKNVVKKTVRKKVKRNVNTNKLAVIGVVLLAFVTVSVIFVLMKLAPSTDTLKAEQIKIPDVVNLGYQEAKDELEALGFLVELGEEEIHNSIRIGNVTSQDPISQTLRKKGFLITLDVSKGSVKELIPDLVQQTDRSAKNEIENSNFELGEIKYENSTLDKGYVISQSPVAGTDAKEGTEINIVVSLGPETTEMLMPSITTKTLVEANELLEPNGIVIEDISYEYSDTVEKDLIISQSVKEQSEIEKNITVNVVISLGVEGAEEADSEDDESDPNAIREKKYNIPLGKYVGETVVIKIVYNTDGKQEMIYNQSVEVTDEITNHYAIVKGSGSGILNVWINDKVVKQIPVDF